MTITSFKITIQATLWCCSSGGAHCLLDFCWDFSDWTFGDDLWSSFIVDALVFVVIREDVKTTNILNDRKSIQLFLFCPPSTHSCFLTYFHTFTFPFFHSYANPPLLTLCNHIYVIYLTLYLSVRLLFLSFCSSIPIFYLTIHLCFFLFVYPSTSSFFSFTHLHILSNHAFF